MKIGVLTVHRAINIGSVMQTYALQEILKGMGHNVCIIDYRQEKVERTDRAKFDFKTRLSFLLHFHLRTFFIYNKIGKATMGVRRPFDSFLNENLNLTEPCDKDNIPTSFDRYVIGSDQLWNSNIFGYQDVVYWGNFNHKTDSKVIAYATSTSVRDLKNTSEEFIKESLSNFCAISMREEETVTYINDKFFPENKLQLVLDPTLVADINIWEKFKKGNYSTEKYILVYGARIYQEDKYALLKQTEDFAKKMGCKIIKLGPPLLSDFIDLICNARYVVSSSFHGVAFSLIFNKPLYAIQYGDEQDYRYKNLLIQIGAEKMLANIGETLNPQNVDYSPINKNLELLRKKSINFLMGM
jgi:hypothetical protein